MQLEGEGGETLTFEDDGGEGEGDDNSSLEGEPTEPKLFSSLQSPLPSIEIPETPKPKPVHVSPRLSADPFDLPPTPQTQIYKPRTHKTISRESPTPTQPRRPIPGTRPPVRTLRPSASDSSLIPGLSTMGKKDKGKDKETFASSPPHHEEESAQESSRRHKSRPSNTLSATLRPEDEGQGDPSDEQDWVEGEKPGVLKNNKATWQWVESGLGKIDGLSKDFGKMDAQLQNIGKDFSVYAEFIRKQHNIPDNAKIKTASDLTYNMRARKPARDSAFGFGNEADTSGNETSSGGAELEEEDFDAELLKSPQRSPENNNRSRSPTHLSDPRGRHKPDWEEDDERRDRRRGRSPSGTGPGRYVRQLKRDEIGVFDPEYDDPDDTGIVTVGKDLVFTDVWAFQERVDTFLDSDDGGGKERQLIELFPTLLQGSAVIWWNNEVTSAERRNLRILGLKPMMRSLELRFAMEPSRATKKFRTSTLALDDIGRDEHILRKFVQKKLRYARAMGTLAENNINWRGVMIDIWSSMDVDIQQYLRPPKRGERMAAYMQELEEMKTVLTNAADKRAESRRQRSYYNRGRNSRYSPSDDSYDSRGQRSSYSNENYGRRQYDSRRDSSRGRGNDRSRDASRTRWRDRSRDRGRDISRDRSRDFSRDRSRDRARDLSRDRSRDQSRDRSRDFSRSRQQSRDSSADSRRGDSRRSSSRDRRDDRDKRERYDNRERRERDRYRGANYVSTGTRADKTSPVHYVEVSPRTSVVKCTCLFCNTLFASRNKLFRHLETCPNKNAELNTRKLIKQRLQEAQVHNVTRTEVEVPDAGRYDVADVVKAVPTTPVTAAAFGGYTHLRINARSAVDGQSQNFCVDTGTGRSLVDREWLKNFRHTVTKEELDTIKGFNGRHTIINELATWTMLIEGTRADGTKALLEETATAYVVDDLDAGALLGNHWLLERKAQIDYETSAITLPDNHFHIPFTVRTQSAHPVVRKVTLVRSIALAPGASAQVAVDYKDLPKGRSFMFSSSHPAALHALIDAATPNIIALHNNSKESIRIGRNTRLGTIHECEDSAYFVSTLGAAARALTLAASMSSVASAPTPSTTACGTHKINLAPRAQLPEGEVGMNAEFGLTNYLVDVATGNDHTKPLEPDVDGPSLTPFTDAVFSVINDSEMGRANMHLDESETAGDAEKGPPDVPKQFGIKGSLSIGTPDDAPSIILPNGIHVFNGTPSQARKLQKVCDDYPDVWVDKGPIDMPEEDQMKIPLMDGWQQAKLNRPRYPASSKDERLIDKVHDTLREQGRMQVSNDVCPFALPVFVVWRTVHGEEKGRVVSDLRPLNKWAVPDNYPLPLQKDVVESIRGKKYLTVIDATSFFYQFLVHPDYRDRFTIISHRGLEQSTVALMGFRNSPAHVQRFMDQLLRKHCRYCRAFIDDIIIYSDTFEEHLHHLRTILRLFQRRGISLSPKKSFIGYPSVELLGFYVDSLGMSTTRERTDAFRRISFPKTLKALETYLGSTGFLRTMIPYYAQISEPLQLRKTAMLAKARKTGRIPTGNKNKRQAFTRSATFDPTPEELKSFKDLQTFLCDKLRLYHMDPRKKLFLQIDGSLQRGFGVMLFQLKADSQWTKGQPIPSTAIQPIMFLSRCLTRAELNYGPSELEVCCLVWACRRLRTTMESNRRQPVVVLTDHDSTRGIVNQTNLNTTSTDRANRRLINASIYLSSLKLDVHHLAGRLNLVPDALSRLATDTDDQDRQKDDEPILDTIMDDLPAYKADGLTLLVAEAKMSEDMRLRFKEHYKEDPTYSKIIDDLKTPANSRKGPVEDLVTATKTGHPFRLVDDLLYNRDNNGRERLVIPKGLVWEYLQDVHDDKHHFARDRMVADLDGFHFRGKRKWIQKYLEACHSCGANRKDNQRPIGTLQPIQAPEEPMHTITLDFITGLPPVSSVGSPWHIDGYDYFDALMPVTCKTSKRKLLIPGHSTYKASHWGMLLGRQILLSDWSCPKVIISDRDSKFTSAFWNALWRVFNTRLMMTTAYHPQSDGQSERTNQEVELAIRYHVAEHPDEPWIDVLPSLQWNLNGAHSRAIDCSPHEYLFGFKIHRPADRLAHTPTKQVAELRYMRQELRRDAQLAMDIAAAHAKRLYDAKHRHEEFEVGDKVWLKLGKAYLPLFRTSRKVMPEREGPYTVIRKVSPLAYELDFNKATRNRRVHPVVSIQYLSRYKADNDPFHRRKQTPALVTYRDSITVAEQPQVERVLDKMIDRRGGGETPRYLVRWEGHGPRDDKWVSAKDMPAGSEDLIRSFERPTKGRDAARAERPKMRQARKVSFADPVVQPDVGSATPFTPNPAAPPAPDTVIHPLPGPAAPIAIESEPLAPEHAVPLTSEPAPTSPSVADASVADSDTNPTPEKPLGRVKRLARAVKRRLGFTV